MVQLSTIHDIVNFGEARGFEYQVTAADASTITIKLKDDPNGAGLQSTICSDKYSTPLEIL